MIVLIIVQLVPVLSFHIQSFVLSNISGVGSFEIYKDIFRVKSIEAEAHYTYLIAVKNFFLFTYLNKGCNSCNVTIDFEIRIVNMPLLVILTVIYHVKRVEKTSWTKRFLSVHLNNFIHASFKKWHVTFILKVTNFQQHFLVTSTSFCLFPCNFNVNDFCKVKVAGK